MKQQEPSIELEPKIFISIWKISSSTKDTNFNNAKRTQSFMCL